MDSKIPSTFWTDPHLDDCDAETLCAILWIKTNDRLNLLGLAEISPRFFTFQTRMPFEVFGRACEALGKGLVVDANTYWLRDHVREQIGCGDSLAKNNMRKPLARALASVASPSLHAAIVHEYPELAEGDHEHVNGSPYQGPEKRRAEQSGEEQSRDGGAGGPGANGSRPRRARGASTRPADHPEPMRSRMVALAAVFSRREDSVWNDAEKKALGAAGLLSIADEDFAEQVAAMRRFYRAKLPPALERSYWRRTTLPTLLNNWPSELDKARAYVRETAPEGDGVTKL